MLIGLSLLFWLVLANAAHAQTSQALALPLKMSGHFPEREKLRNALTRQITGSITQAGYVAITASSTSNAKCHDEICLESIRQAQKVDLVITSEILSDDTLSPDYSLRVWVVGRYESRHIRAVEDRCVDCSENMASAKLAALCAEAISDRDPLALAIRKPAVARKPRAGYLALGSIGAIGTVGSLVALGVVLHYHNQTLCDAYYPLNRPCPYRYDATVPAIVSGISAAAFAALTGVGFGLAYKPEKTLSVALAPAIVPGGGAVLLNGRF